MKRNYLYIALLLGAAALIGTVTANVIMPDQQIATARNTKTPAPSWTPRPSRTFRPPPGATQIATATPGASSTPAPTASHTATLDPSLTPTSGPTQPAATNTPAGPTATPGAGNATSTPFSTPAGTFYPTQPATPAPGSTNLVFNGTFENGQAGGWTEHNGYYSAPPAGFHRPVPCSPSGTWYAQIDRDVGENGWPDPAVEISEDWIWQVIQAPAPHNALILGYEEGHHVDEMIARLLIYGRPDPGGSWQLVHWQIGPRAPWGAGKCQIAAPGVFSDLIPLAVSFPEYRIEIYGQLITPQDGLLWGDIRIYTVNAE